MMTDVAIQIASYILGGLMLFLGMGMTNDRACPVSLGVRIVCGLLWPLALVLAFIPGVAKPCCNYHRERGR